jgi:hypothetical protein
MDENQIYNNIYQSLKNFGISSQTADSIASLSSINDFYKKNIHIAYTVINNKEIWSMNQKKMKILNSRKCSEHAEERLIKKINRCFYRKKNINNISVYSLRINRLGEIKCAKPCKECVKYLINSKIKVKEIIWYEYRDNKIKAVSAKPNPQMLLTCGVSSGRKYYRRRN